MKSLFVLLAVVLMSQGAFALPRVAEEAAATPCPFKAAQNKSPWDMNGTYTGNNTKSGAGTQVTDKSI